MTKIIWMNCADEMPPDDESEVIIRNIENKDQILTPADEIYYDIDEKELLSWQWTPYTPEQWEELSK